MVKQASYSGNDSPRSLPFLPFMGDDHFGVLSQRALPNLDSGHVSLLLSHDEELGGPSPFFFFF